MQYISAKTHEISVMLDNCLGKISDNLHSNNKNNWLERRVWPLKIFSRCSVVDLSILLEQQSSSCDHCYIYLIDTCLGTLYQISNRCPFQKCSRGWKQTQTAQCYKSNVIPQWPVVLFAERVMIRSEPSSLMANYSKIKKIKLPQSHIAMAVKRNQNLEE